MTSISRFLCLLLLGAAIPAFPLRAQAPPPTAEARRAAVEHGLQRAIQVVGRPVETSTIRERMGALGVPAVSVAVIHEGAIDWAMAWGEADVESGRAASPGTLFQAASMSKPIAALAALIMVEAGELSLDDDVNRVLREWQVPANHFTAARPVTLRALLSHTAGTTIHGFPGYAAGTPLPSAVQVLNGGPPANTAAVLVDTVPGSRWRYSGGGYTVVQQLLAERAGTSFPELLRKRVLDPLGLHASTFDQPLPDSLHPLAATAYADDGAPVAGRFHGYPELAAAGLWTTPSDYARYVIAIQRALRDEPGAILSRAMVDTMLTHVRGGYGLGVAVTGTGESRRFSHGGANAGFRSSFVGYAERGAGVVVMTNSDNGAPLAQEIVLAVARVYGWPGLQATSITPVPVDSAALDAYAGTYALEGFRIAVTRTADRLMLSQNEGEPLELVPVGTDAFLYLGGGQLIRFERNETAEVVAIRAGNTRVPRAR